MVLRRMHTSATLVIILAVTLINEPTAVENCFYFWLPFNVAYFQITQG